MADDTHVPEWEEIATGFGEYAEWLCAQEDSDAGYGHDYRDGSGYLAAHRWLAAHDAEVRARALREAADYAESFVGEPAHHDRSPVLHDGVEEKAFTLEAWLRDRADKIEKGEGA